MGCRSDYLAATDKESKMQHAAKLQLWLTLHLKMNVPTWLKKEAENIYASDERNVTGLCAILSELDKKARDKLLYGSAKDKDRRALAEWWEEHEAADKKRISAEKKDKRQEKLREQALAKLTPAERKALGL